MGQSRNITEQEMETHVRTAHAVERDLELPLNWITMQGIKFASIEFVKLCTITIAQEESEIRCYLFKVPKRRHQFCLSVISQGHFSIGSERAKGWRLK